MKDSVMIKSSKYGLAVHLEKELPYKELLVKIEEKFKASAHFFEGNAMAVSFENRMLTKAEEQEIINIISSAAKIQILCIIDHCEKTGNMYKRVVEQSLTSIPKSEGQFYRGTLKKRQTLESETSIVIIGDVEEGAVVAAKGSIVVIGTICGCAYAGVSGNKNAFIAALYMTPKRLRIGDNEVKPVIGGSYSWAKLS